MTEQKTKEKNSSSILSPPRPARKTFRKYVGDQFEDLLDGTQLHLFRLVSRLCRSSPEVLLDAGRATLRDAAFYSLHRIRQICFGNLTIARGEIWDADEIHRFARSVYGFWSDVVVDFLRLRHVIDDRNWRKFIRVEGRDYLNQAYEQSGGVIVAGPHMANWEFIGQTLAWMGYPITSIAQRRRHSSGIDGELMRWRRKWGQNVVYTEESPRKLLRVLREGEVLGIVADQYSGEDGIFTDFFGAPAGHYPGVAVFANRMEVPVVPVYCHRDSNGTYHVVFNPPIHPITEGERSERNRELIRRLFRRFEQYIHRYPRQWLWIHRKWRDRWLREEHLDLLRKAPYLINYTDG